MDELIPNLLGVSKAILQNVIFCHQDDSTWPFQDSAIVKKKFDAIFESDKYTKAVDELKKERKKFVDNVTTYQNEYIANREKYNFVIDIRKDIEKNEKIVEEIQKDLKEKENKSILLENRYNEINKIFDDYNSYVIELSKLKGELDSCLHV